MVQQPRTKEYCMHCLLYQEIFPGLELLFSAFLHLCCLIEGFGLFLSRFSFLSDYPLVLSLP